MGAKGKLLWIFLCTGFWMVSCQTPPERAAKDAPPSEHSPTEPEIVRGDEPESKIDIQKTPEIVPQPSPSLNIESQARAIGAKAGKKGDDKWEISKGDRSLVLTEESRVAELNGTVLFLNEAFIKRDDTLRLGELDYEYTLKPAMYPLALKLGSRRVVIDPGHGGTETGTRNETLGVFEKELNLDVAIRVRYLLEDEGVNVVMTRYDDRVVSLEDRLKIANRAKPALFASIHFNAAPNLKAEGIETYVLTPPIAVSSNDSLSSLRQGRLAGNGFDYANFEIGFLVQRKLISDLQRVDRGLKRARFKVLTELGCPGILIECGFLSNDKEALLVNTPVFRQRLAKSLSEAILELLSQE
jgi:N-acetylmuramoyl-L-alanine amidase